VTFRFIADHTDEWPVAWMCEALEVSASGYYAWFSRPDSATEQWRQELLGAVGEVHADVKGRYGSPRMTAELNARGHACSENTVADLMREHGIRAKSPRRFVRTTDSNHRLPVADNVLDRDFEPEGPNARWCADITYIPTGEGWLYLAVVEDLFSRMIVGWSMDESMESRLVVDALEMAIQRRRPEAGLLAHSDRGSQYASDHYQRVLAAEGVVCSMSEVGQCWDNAPVESFFGRLKCELEPGEMFATRDQARAELFEYLEVFYNRVRRHSSLGFLSPEEFERTYNQTHR
jgi:transposase InsO family protein